jgi:cyclohexa-1,5-dienecarbonyl-CoA hydratase
MADYTDDPHDSDVYAPAAPAGYRYLQAVTAQGICRITLNRPPANVLSVDLMQEVSTALDGLEYERDVKLVVLAAQGKYFSAGFELTDHLGDRAYMMLEAYRRIFENFAKLDKPTLAVVAGSALGAGSMLAAGCDMVLAARSAKFGCPEIRGGVFNPVTAAALPRILGRRKAFELVFGAASIGAEEAERIGLITRACPDESLDAEVATVIQRFQELSAPVVQLVRRAMTGGLDLPFAEALGHGEDVYLNQLLGTHDAEEGLRAIAEKRKPNWLDR